jgi:MFS transporter, DHA1 family, multidrug resistance protein
VLGNYLGGKFQHKWDVRKFLLLACLFNALTIFVFIFTSTSSLILLIMNIAFFGLFLGLSSPNQLTLLTDAFPKQRATAIGIYNFFRFSGMAFGPLVGSFLYEYGNVLLLFGVIFILFMGIVWFAWWQLMRKREMIH